jgi:hypothetical protein
MTVKDRTILLFLATNPTLSQWLVNTPIQRVKIPWDWDTSWCHAKADTLGGTTCPQVGWAALSEHILGPVAHLGHLAVQDSWQTLVQKCNAKEPTMHTWEQKDPNAML